MIRKSVNTILVGSNLAVNRGCGLKDGLVVGNNGMNQVAVMEIIEVTLKWLK